jgi:hypothetical protein
MRRHVCTIVGLPLTFIYPISITIPGIHTRNLAAHHLHIHLCKVKGNRKIEEVNMKKEKWSDFFSFWARLVAFGTFDLPLEDRSMVYEECFDGRSHTTIPRQKR